MSRTLYGIVRYSDGPAWVGCNVLQRALARWQWWNLKIPIMFTYFKIILQFAKQFYRKWIGLFHDVMSILYRNFYLLFLTSFFRAVLKCRLCIAPVEITYRSITIHIFANMKYVPCLNLLSNRLCNFLDFKYCIMYIHIWCFYFIFREIVIIVSNNHPPWWWSSLLAIIILHDDCHHC